jgi:hypothetical protein
LFVKGVRPNAFFRGSRAEGDKGCDNPCKAIIERLKDSVEAFSQGSGRIESKDVLVLVRQYLDTTKEIGANDKSNTISMSHRPARSAISTGRCRSSHRGPERRILGRRALCGLKSIEYKPDRYRYTFGV